MQTVASAPSPPTGPGCAGHRRHARQRRKGVADSAGVRVLHERCPPLCLLPLGMVLSKAFAVTVLAASAGAAPAADRVASLPGFEPTKFGVYSGYLKVAGPFKMNE